MRSPPLYQTDASLLALETSALDVRPGAVLLDRCIVFPGGGQLADRATLRWSRGEAAITAVTSDERGWWHAFDGEDEPDGPLQVSVEPEFRRLMCELHTLAHIANSVVFREFNGALLTGAQLSDDKTFRLDLDLPGSDAARSASASERCSRSRTRYHDAAAPSPTTTPRRTSRPRDSAPSGPRLSRFSGRASHVKTTNDTSTRGRAVMSGP